MVRYSWWRGSLGVIFMASYFTHGIFDPLSCTGTQWIVDKVMLEHSLHSVLICDIPTVRFQLDCSRAAVCPCTLFRVPCRPHSEGCDTSLVYVKLDSSHLLERLFNVRADGLFRKGHAGCHVKQSFLENSENTWFFSSSYVSKTSRSHFNLENLLHNISLYISSLMYGKSLLSQK